MLLSHTALASILGSPLSCRLLSPNDDFMRTGYRQTQNRLVLEQEQALVLQQVELGGQELGQAQGMEQEQGQPESQVV